MNKGLSVFDGMVPEVKRLVSWVSQQAMEALLKGEAKEYFGDVEIDAEKFPNLAEYLKK